MISQCPPRLTDAAGSAYGNVSQLLMQRWDDSPKDDRERLERCWGYLDCGDCHRSDGFCGWCPISGTCLPLPLDPLSRAFPLLAPTRYKFICAMGPERFELRTSGLGCQVSTITFLTSIVTIFCTIFGLIVLYGLIKLIKWSGLLTRAEKGGWIIYEDGREEVWVRKSEGWGRWWRRITGRQRENEELVLDEGAVERSRWWWSYWRRGNQAQNRFDERRPLLQ